VSLLLVHGAWADGSSWDKVVPLLEQKGYKVVAVHLPLTSATDDIAATTRAIEAQPGDVLLVGHSYGGFVISRAGNSPKVKGLVFVDAFGLDDRETANGLFGGAPPPWFKTLERDGGGYLWMPLETIRTTFAPDLPLAEQRLIAAKQGPVPVSSFDEPMLDPAWKTKPTWYVRGTADKIIPPDAQAAMAKRMNAKTVSVAAGHLSMLSKPREVAAVILDAAGAQAPVARR
jgi:pimeloyl-ACP methyl ester carboxylesterase